MYSNLYCFLKPVNLALIGLGSKLWVWDLGVERSIRIFTYTEIMSAFDIQNMSLQPR